MSKTFSLPFLLLSLKDVALWDDLLSFLSSNLYLPGLSKNSTNLFNIEPEQLCCFTEKLEYFDSIIFEVCLTLYTHNFDQLYKVTLFQEVAWLNDYRKGIQEFTLYLHRSYVGLLSRLQTWKFWCFSIFYNFKQFVVNFNLLGINTLSMNLAFS